MTEVTVDGSVLRIGDERIPHDHSIQTVERCDGLIVVVLETGPADAERDNVLAYDTDGRRVWRIEPLPESGDTDNTYVNVFVRDGELWVGAWRGTDYRIDPETGRHVDSVFRK